MELKCPYHGKKYMRINHRNPELSYTAYQCDVCGYTIIQRELWPCEEDQ